MAKYSTFSSKPSKSPSHFLRWCCCCCYPKEDTVDFGQDTTIKPFPLNAQRKAPAKLHFTIPVLKVETYREFDPDRYRGENAEGDFEMKLVRTETLVEVADKNPSRDDSKPTNSVAETNVVRHVVVKRPVSADSSSSDEPICDSDPEVFTQLDIVEAFRNSIPISAARKDSVSSLPLSSIMEVELETEIDHSSMKTPLIRVDDVELNLQDEQEQSVIEEKSISEESTSTPTTPSRHLHGDAEEDIDRLVAIHQQRTSLSSLGPRSDSMASVYSGAGESRYGTVTVRGEVEFSLSYNYKSSALEISIKQCRDLAAVDAKRNRSDPYVKVYLLPDKSKSGKRKTKVKKHTLNPIFDETLKFAVGLDELESRTLWLTVWHSDMFGRNDFLGEVMMSMENKVFDDPSPRFYHLNERTEPFDDLATYKGDLILALKFVPPDVTVVKKGKRSRGALHVLVKEAKNLMAVKAVGTSDPFCKCYLLPDKGRASKQKTPVARRTCNPVWNYTFVYEDVSLQELSERCLELTAWDHDRLASNEFLGGLRFSLGTGKHHGKTVDWMDAGGKELQLWQSMLQRPNFWVEGSVALRPSLEQRSSV